MKIALLWLVTLTPVVVAASLPGCGDGGVYGCPDPNVCCACDAGGTGGDAGHD